MKCCSNVSRVNSCHSKEKIVETANYYYKNPDKWDPYSLRYNNCEHFAQFCATGVKKSSQVESVQELVESVVGIGKEILKLIPGSEVISDDLASLGAGRQMENHEPKSRFEDVDLKKINRALLQDIEKAQERPIFEIEETQESSNEKGEEKSIF